MGFISFLRCYSLALCACRVISTRLTNGHSTAFRANSMRAKQERWFLSNARSEYPLEHWVTFTLLLQGAIKTDQTPHVYKKQTHPVCQRWCPSCASPHRGLRCRLPWLRKVPPREPRPRKWWRQTRGRCHTSPPADTQHLTQQTRVSMSSRSPRVETLAHMRGSHSPSIECTVSKATIFGVEGSDFSRSWRKCLASLWRKINFLAPLFLMPWIIEAWLPASE